jgi:predicted membrane channel-forming protein YqfA (hemolysin III family)
VTLGLIVAGGLVYSLGAIVFLSTGCAANAIWQLRVGGIRVLPHHCPWRLRLTTKVSRATASQVWCSRPYGFL